MALVLNLYSYISEQSYQAWTNTNNEILNSIYIQKNINKIDDFKDKLSVDMKLIAGAIEFLVFRIQC